MQVKCVVFYKNATNETVVVPLTVDCTAEQFDEGIHLQNAKVLATIFGYVDCHRVYDQYEPAFGAFLYLFEDVALDCCG